MKNKKSLNIVIIIIIIIICLSSHNSSFANLYNNSIDYYSLSPNSMLDSHPLRNDGVRDVEDLRSSYTGVKSIIDDDFVVQQEVKKALVIVPFPYKEIPYAQRAKNFIPLGAGYICASMIEELGPENVDFLDLTVVNDGFDLEIYLVENKYDLVALSVSSDVLIDMTYDYVKEIRRSLPEGIIVVGGIVPSVDQNRIINESDKNIDIVVKSEGEDVIKNVIKACNEKVSLRKISGITAVNAQGEIMSTAKSSLPDIHKLPNPPWDFIDLKKYELSGRYMGDDQVVNIISSRGCPYSCAYCSYKAVSGKHVRLRDAESIFREMMEYNEKYGITRFYFADDYFTVNKKRINNLCNLIIKSGKIFTWRAQTRADAISDGGLLRLMKEAGCNYIALGIESADPRVLRAVNKKLDIDAVTHNMALAQSIGIKVRIFLMVGLPEQDWVSIRRTADFIRRTKPDIVVVKMCIPFSGSPILGATDKYGITLLPGSESSSTQRMIHDDFARSDSDLSLEAKLRPLHKTKWMDEGDIFRAKRFLEEVAAGIGENNKWYELADSFVDNVINNVRTKIEYQKQVDKILRELVKADAEEKKIFIDYLWIRLSVYAEEIPIPNSTDDSRVLFYNYNIVEDMDIHICEGENKPVRIYKTLGGNPTNAFTAFRILGNKAKVISYPEEHDARLAVLMDPFRKLSLTAVKERFSLNIDDNTKKVFNELEKMDKNSVFVFGGSFYSTIQSRTLGKLIEKAKDRQILTVADFSMSFTREESLRILQASPHVIKPNLKEFEMLCRYSGILDDDVELNSDDKSRIYECAKWFCDNYDIKAVTITLGSNGAIICTKNKAYYGYSNIAEEDIKGLFCTGDAFCAGMVQALLEEDDLSQPDNINWEIVLERGLKVGAAKVILPGKMFPTTRIVDEQNVYVEEQVMPILHDLVSFSDMCAVAL